MLLEYLKTDKEAYGLPLSVPIIRLANETQVGYRH
jgi:hypothetical protein